ncbi:DUF3667 domain-containing protein [Flavisolibacter ginsenosidimutans]|uniref:DUF3667 domain-containing protein n=1 Tax=Flavisolibacter ginsenosidimutans TaxID=661481 RepID=UPI00155AA953|nr:DUF3667 domain-containing protein [Flavisolibacter ginsenosidimutans]
MAKHFIYDVLHFDGKFFHTLLYIFTRPGFVAKQYVQGKRMSYLDPIRMYLFTSAVFFLVFFSVKTFNVGEKNHREKPGVDKRKELIESYKKHLEKNPADSEYARRIAYLRDTLNPVNPDSLGWHKSIGFGNRSYTSLENYDSVQASLPTAERDGWFPRRIIHQFFTSKEKYGESDEVLKVFLETFLHKLPYLLFVSLPFFAGILKLLYIRRKTFFYSDHAVFTLYHYIFSFILMLVGFAFSGLQDATGWSVFGFLTGLLFLVWPVYLFIEMRRFYEQGFKKTFVKFIILNCLGFVLIMLLFLIFALFSFFQS